MQNLENPCHLSSINLGSYLFHGVAKQFQKVSIESHGIFWGDVIDAEHKQRLIAEESVI